MTVEQMENVMMELVSNPDSFKERDRAENFNLIKELVEGYSVITDPANKTFLTNLDLASRLYKMMLSEQQRDKISKAIQENDEPTEVNLYVVEWISADDREDK